MKKTVSTLLLSLIMAVSFGQTLYGDYRVVVDVTGNGYSHNTQIYFDDESWDPQNPPSYGWDPCCDANVLGVSSGDDRPFIFTEVVEPPAPTPNYMLSLNGLPLLFEQTDVPMGFLPGTLAEYTFTFTEQNSLPLGVSVELEDLALNVTQDLLTNPTYVTWGAPSDDEARFVVHFYPSNITATNANRKIEMGIYRENQQITLEAQARIESAVLTDLCGKTVGELKGHKKRSVRFQMGGFPKGLYILNVVFADGQVVSKRFVY